MSSIQDFKNTRIASNVPELIALAESLNRAANTGESSNAMYDAGVASGILTALSVLNSSANNKSVIEVEKLKGLQRTIDKVSLLAGK